MIHATTQLFGTSSEKKNVTCPWECCQKNNGRRTVTYTYRHGATFARNRSRRTSGEFTIIAISLVDTSPAHANCNLNYKNLLYILIVFHNLSGYDAHLKIKEIATAYDGHVDV